MRVGRVTAGLAEVWIVPAMWLLGVAARLYRLTYHSLWLDEAISVDWARLPAQRIAEVGLQLVQDKHPPVYYLMLHAWVGQFGDGEVSIRLLSALLGALAAPFGYLLMREIAGRPAAVLGGLLLAVNPFLVWYGQEVRMFGLAASLLVGAAWLLVAAVRRGGAWRWIGWVVLGTLAFYTYLFSALTLAALGLWGVFRIAKTRKDTKTREEVARFWGSPVFSHLRGPNAFALASMAAMAVLCAPLAWQAWRVGSGEATLGVPFTDIGGQLASLASAFVFWKAPAAGPLAAAVLIVLGLAALWGAVSRVEMRRPVLSPNLLAPGMGEGAGGEGTPVGVLLFLLIVPWLAANALLWVDRTVFDEPRYLIVLAPAFLLAIARLASSTGRRARLAGFAAVALALAAFAWSWPYGWSPDARREEWRGTARYIEAHEQPGDAILIHADFAYRPFLYYYRGTNRVNYPFTGPMGDDEEIGRVLAEPVRQPALWLVRSHEEPFDPDNRLERWLAARYPLITEQYPPGVTVKGYATGYRTADLPAGVPRLNATFPVGDGALRLAGIRIDSTLVAARDNLFHPPSGWLHVTLYWTAEGKSQKAEVTDADGVRGDTTAAFEGDWRFELRLTDAAGQVWGRSLDRPTSAVRMYPPSRWQAGETIRDDHDVNLNPITPPGRYQLELEVEPPGAPSHKLILGEIEIKDEG